MKIEKLNAPNFKIMLSNEEAKELIDKLGKQYDLEKIGGKILEEIWDMLDDFLKGKYGN